MEDKVLTADVIAKAAALVEAINNTQEAEEQISAGRLRRTDRQCSSTTPKVLVFRKVFAVNNNTCTLDFYSQRTGGDNYVMPCKNSEGLAAGVLPMNYVTKGQLCNLLIGLCGP